MKASMTPQRQELLVKELFQARDYLSSPRLILDTPVGLVSRAGRDGRMSS
jgi:hypothetical protein